MKNHDYSISIQWTGNRGESTPHYRAYGREYEVRVEGKPVLSMSSDPAFMGKHDHYNPEEMLVAALSGCHMLWFLHLASEQKVLVEAYADQATGTMAEQQDGSGRFLEVILKPMVTVRDESMLSLLDGIHHTAGSKCFIANSVNFPVVYQPGAIVLAQ